MIIDGLTFDQTCGACPEQYDVFKDGEQVGYVRLRHGYLRVDVPDCGDTTIYEHSFSDGWQGIFDSEDQRTEHLTKIATAINDTLAYERVKRLREIDWTTEDET